MKNDFTKITFIKNSCDEDFYKEVKQRVRDYFLKNNLSRYGTCGALIKGIIIAALFAALYLALIIYSNGYVLMQLLYIGAGATSLILAFNFAHDACHQSLTPYPKLDKLIFEILFNLQGGNAYLWRMRHLKSHHIFPNVEGADADLDSNNLIKLYPGKEHKYWYKFQHLYAPILYMFYTLMWVFYKDFAFLLKTRHANLIIGTHPRFEILKLFFYKILYLTLFLFVPLIVIPLPASQVIIGFIIMHFVISLWTSFTFLISHYCMKVQFPELNNRIINNSWARHQMEVSVDFHAESRLANILFGGFNAHLAHHLFPTVSHVHYPAITSIIKETLKEYGLEYKSVTFPGGILSHLRLLQFLGKETSVSVN